MHDDYDYEDFYSESSEFEEKIEEFKEVLVNSIKENWIFKMQKLNEENVRLKAIEHEMKEIIRVNEVKKDNFSRKEIELKKELEREFYKTRLEDIIKNYIEENEIFYAEEIHSPPLKCQMCDTERNITARFPNGKETKTNCDCAINVMTYEPNTTIIKSFKNFALEICWSVIVFTVKPAG